MSKDNNFEKILEVLKEIHRKHPEQRFGLILQNSLDHVKRKNNINLGDYSSKDILRCLTEYGNFVTKRKKVLDKNVIKLIKREEIPSELTKEELVDLVHVERVKIKQLLDPLVRRQKAKEEWNKIKDKLNGGKQNVK